MTDPVVPSEPTPAPVIIPNRASANFSQEIIAWFNWQVISIGEAEELARVAYINAVAARGHALAAAESAGAATTNGAQQVALAAEQVALAAQQVGLAGNAAQAAVAAAAAAAAIANFKGEWSALTGALNMPATVLHSNGFWVLLANLADVATSEPGVTADWASSAGGGGSSSKSYFFGSM